MGKRILPNIPLASLVASDIFKGVWGAGVDGVSLGGLKMRLVENSDTIPAFYVDGNDSPVPCMGIVLFTNGSFLVAEYTQEAKLTSSFRYALLIASED